MEADQDVRIIIVGDSAVGKTTLLMRYLDRSFSPSSCSTINPSFTPAQINTTSGKVVRVQLWDTAGQEKFHGISKIFYRNSQYAVICYSATNADSLPSITGWKQRILDEEPKCRIFLAATKMDLIPDEHLAEYMSTGEELKQKIGASAFHMTSAITGSGIDELFLDIANNYCATESPTKTVSKEPKHLDISKKEKEPESECGC